MPLPRVSIVMPMFNRLAYLREAVATVLAQTCEDWELIAVDDGSVEGNVGWMRALGDTRISVIAVGHSGHIAHLRNIGCARASAEYIAMFDSDDRWLPQKLERQLALHAARPAVQWSYTNRAMIDADGHAMDPHRFRPWEPVEGHVLEDVLTMRANIALPTVMVTRRAFEEVGGFDERAPHGEDYGLWIRLAEEFECGVVTEPLAEIRSWHSTTFGMPGVNLGLAHAFGEFQQRSTDRRLRAVARRRQAEHTVAAAQLYVKSGQLTEARLAISAAIPLMPFAPFPWRALLRWIAARITHR